MSGRIQGHYTRCGLAQALPHEASGQGVAAGLVDEQEVAHGATSGVVLHGQFLGGLQRDVRDVVEGGLLRVVSVGDAIEVEDAVDARDTGLDLGRAVAQLEHLTRGEVLLGEDDGGGGELADGLRAGAGGKEIAAGEVDLIGKPEDDGVAGAGGIGRPIGGVNVGHGRGAAVRGGDLIAHGDGAGLHTARVAALVRGVLADDVLDGETEVEFLRAATGDGDGLKDLQHRGAGVPVHVGGRLDNVIALERGDGHDS